MFLKKKANHYIAFFIILIVFFLYFISLKSGHNWGGDFAAYIIQAKYLSEGKVALLNDLSDFRYKYSSYFLPQYAPWGYSLLLIPILELSDMNIQYLKIYNIFYFMFALYLIFMLFKEKLGILFSISVIIIIALNSSFFSLRNQVISDLPHLLFSLLSIFLIDKYILKENQFIRTRSFTLFLIGVVIFFSYMIRSQSIALFPTLVLSQLIFFKFIYKKTISFSRYKIKILSPYIAIFLGFILLRILLPAYSYGDIVNFSNLHNNIIRQSYYYFDTFSTIFNFNFSNSVSHFIFAVTIPICFYSILKNYKQDYLFIIYFLAGLALLLVVPYRQGLRYAFPILPFYLYFLFSGFKLFKLKFYNISISSLCSSILVVLAIFSFLKSSWKITLSTDIIKGPYTTESINTFSFIKKSIPEKDPVVFWKPRVMTLYTGRKSCIIDRKSALINLLSDFHNVYFVFYNDAGYHQLNVSDLIDTGYYIEKIFSNNDFSIYNLKTFIPSNK